MTAVDVCLCTYERPSVEATLVSLARQEATDVHLRVIVADNARTDTARARILAVGAREGLRLIYLHAPAGNISVARNAALGAATAPWVAILDDDEIAEPAWLVALLATARRTGADVILGPVVARYDASAPHWLIKGDFHSTVPARRGGSIRTGYTSNVLFAREALPLAGLRFRKELGRSGGEDTEFFDRAHRAGATFAYASDAVVSEEVTPERARLGWLLSRRFRSGQSHALLLAADRPAPGRRAAEVAVACGKAGVSALAAALALPLPRWRAFWLLRGALHAGVVWRLLGASQIELYGEKRHER
jgi:succinoglycan biosynthesis protein ExoM